MDRRGGLRAITTLFITALAGCAAAPPPSKLDSLELKRPPRAPVQHTFVPAVKVAGPPAVLTPEAQEAGLRGPLRLKCFVSLRGRVALCDMPPEVPPSQRDMLWTALRDWRFRAATHDGVPFAAQHDLDVPLVPPPPGWSPPTKDPVPGQNFSAPDPEPGGEMTPPKLIEAAMQVTYPREALEQGIEGKVIARCTITEEGNLVDCDILRSLPYLDQPVLATLATRRYTPAIYKGKPVRVFYTFPFTFKMPR